MKKIFMTLAAAVMAVTMNAQVYVGGGVGVANTDNGTNDYTTFKFVPEVGYVFNEDWAAGIAFGWQGANKGNAKEWTINPYVRYTLFNGKIVDAFLDGSIGYGHLYNAGYDTDELSIGIKPGVAVKLNNRLSLVTHIGFVGYAHEKDNNTDTKVDNWGLSLDGNNIVFGLYYNF